MSDICLTKHAAPIQAPAGGANLYVLPDGSIWTQDGDTLVRSQLVTTTVLAQFGLTVVTTNINYTASPTNELVLASGILTVTLPDATTTKGVQITVKNIGTGTVTVSAVGGQTLDGQGSTDIMSRYESLAVVSDGSNWYII